MTQPAKTNDASGVSALEQFLADEWPTFVEKVESFQWPVETARWHELVFCLLDQIARPEMTREEVRQVTDALVSLDLLDVDRLAHRPSPPTEDLPADDGAIVQRILQHAGLSEASAEAAVLAVREAASSLQQRYDGKVQRCLRRYGQMMLDDLRNQFSFSSLAPEDARNVFTLWLQNVLTMPLQLWDQDVAAMATELGATRDSLEATADRLDINVALLDDVLSSYVHPRGATEAAG